MSFTLDSNILNIEHVFPLEIVCLKERFSLSCLIYFLQNENLFGLGSLSKVKLLFPLERIFSYSFETFLSFTSIKVSLNSFLRLFLNFFVSFDAMSSSSSSLSVSVRHSSFENDFCSFPLNRRLIGLGHTKAFLGLFG